MLIYMHQITSIVLLHSLLVNLIIVKVRQVKRVRAFGLLSTNFYIKSSKSINKSCIIYLTRYDRLSMYEIFKFPVTSGSYRSIGYR